MTLGQSKAKGFAHMFHSYSLFEVSLALNLQMVEFCKVNLSNDLDNILMLIQRCIFAKGGILCTYVIGITFVAIQNMYVCM